MKLRDGLMLFSFFILPFILLFVFGSIKILAGIGFLVAPIIYFVFRYLDGKYYNPG